MNPGLSETLLSQFSDFIAARIGLHFPPERWRDLERGIGSAARDFALGDAQACVTWLLSAPLTHGQIEILASHLTVGETYFFREKRSLGVLEERIFPELLRARERTERRLRIWSAGCCTGEEPYSIAMLLDRLIPDSEKWNVTILATDINPAFLRKATEGEFGEWSFRNTPDWVRERYFKRTKKGRFEILPHIRKRVTFSYLNLADDVYPSLTNNTNAMDVIFCRNVLMYFSPAWVKKIAQNFHRSLVNGGWLIVSPTETSSSLFPQFKAMTFPGAVLYHKSKSEDAESQVSVAGSSASLFDPVPDTLRMPTPALSPDPYIQDEGRSFPLKDAQPETSAAVTNEPVQPLKAASVAAHPLNQDGRDALCRTARFYANQGQLTEAIAWCEKAIAADKLNPATHYLLATIRQEQGESEAAAQSLMRALYLDPDFVLAHFALGNLRLAQGRHREAQRHFDNAQALLHTHPQDEILPESEGLTAGRLGEIIASVRLSLPRAAVTNA